MLTFKDLPIELRLEIWRHMSLVDYPKGLINIFPPCDGQCRYTRSWDCKHLRQYFSAYPMLPGVQNQEDSQVITAQEV